MASIVPALRAGGTGYRCDQRPSIRADVGSGSALLPEVAQAFAQHQQARTGHSGAEPIDQEFRLQVQVPAVTTSWNGLFGWRGLFRSVPRQTVHTLDLYVADNDETPIGMDYEPRVSKTDTLIIAWPINATEDPTRLERLQRIAPSLAASAMTKPQKRKDATANYLRRRSRPKDRCVYVVVGRYEVVLDAQPDRAVTEILSPEEVREEMRWFLRRNGGLDDVLRELSAHCDVYLLPQSSFGVIRGFDGPNVVLAQAAPPQAQDQPLLAPGGTGELDMRLKFHPSRLINDGGRSRTLMFQELWLPLFSADAFIAAATGRRHAWFIDYSSIKR